jgi:hypothetical protein
MKKIQPLLVLVALLGIAGSSRPATASMCTLDAVPAATLLLPYFEVDLLRPDCVYTLLSINNALPTATIAHVTLWTDWSQPTVDFDIFLTGFDVVTISLLDVFEGSIPITADEQSDPDDTISPHGDPSWDDSFTNSPDCINFFPFFQNPVITGFRLDLLRQGHRGLPVQFGNGRCIGQPYGDTIARGYLTIDNAVRCGLEDPSHPEYFGGANPVASNVNQLWGDYFIVDPINNSAFGNPLVHIEADDAFVPGTVPTDYTFYGRYTADENLDDQREPLGTTWAARYLNGGAFTGGTEYLVWRDSTTNNIGFFTCGVGPNWLPLNETDVVAFDEEENAVELCFSRGGGVISPPDPEVDPACFPLETQRVRVGEGELDPPSDFGWMYLNLNIDDVGVTGDVDFGANGDIAQSYVDVTHSALGRFQVGLQAIELTQACEDDSPLLGPLLPDP